jgi:membrane-associated HD superfamily phosphohydrolase
MTKAPNNPPSRIADLARSVRARASVWGRFKGAALRAVDGLASPSMGWGLLIAIIFAAVCSVTAAITRLQPLVAVGRVMDTTRIVRHEIVTEDESQTQQRREAARQATPRVYVADAAAIDAIVRSLENLPKTLAAAESPADVDPTIREQFGLTADLLKAVKGEVVEGEASPVWRARVRTLAALLLRRPLLDQQTWQRGTLEGTAATIKLMADGKPLSPVLRTEAVNVDDKEALSAAMQAIARDSGFVDPLRAVVVARLTRGARPTYAFDAAATAKDQNDAAAAAPPPAPSAPWGRSSSAGARS